MKTGLRFEAPSDLSVGTVRIMAAGGTIANWVATPSKRIFQKDDVKPGIYAVEITPAGVAPQSVVFEVKENEDNRVALPTFSALSASGSNTSFFDSESGRFSSELPPSTQLALRTISGVHPRKRTGFLLPRDEAVKEPIYSHPLEMSKESRRLSIGLSEETRGRENFTLFRGQTAMELSPARLELVVQPDPERKLWAPCRVRMSAAIEMVRIERCLLPLYRNGTRITFTAPPFAISDIEFGVIPVDPTIRSLVRALDAGSSAEASAVRKSILPKNNPLMLLNESGDPWTAILVGLLAIRFPKIFRNLNTEWANQLVSRVPWAFDAKVIHASLTLAAAREASEEAQAKAVMDAIVSLAGAQSLGSPYYRYANQLFGEMAGSIAGYLQQEGRALTDPIERKFQRLYRRWHRELPLQRGAGFTFTWLARDPNALKELKVLTPYRRPSGRLRGRDTKIIFEGKVSPGSIEIIADSKHSRSTPGESSTTETSDKVVSARPIPQIPALSKTPGPDDDPNKGRFGGEASRKGFDLETTFESKTNSNWVTINFSVRAKEGTATGLGDFAWFVLHPTFSPPMLKVAFRNGSAKLSIQAYGGFTVGVWIPKFNVVLESDLSQLANAPKIIKER